MLVSQHRKQNLGISKGKGAQQKCNDLDLHLNGAALFRVVSRCDHGNLGHGTFVRRLTTWDGVANKEGEAIKT